MKHFHFCCPRLNLSLGRFDWWVCILNNSKYVRLEPHQKTELLFGYYTRLQICLCSFSFNYFRASTSSDRSFRDEFWPRRLWNPIDRRCKIPIIYMCLFSNLTQPLSLGVLFWSLSAEVCKINEQTFLHLLLFEIVIGSRRSKAGILILSLVNGYLNSHK